MSEFETRCPGCHSGPFADFDHYCDSAQIAPEDAPVAFGAWLEAIGCENVTAVRGRRVRGGGGMTLTVGSLFSGIGGLDLGLERAGMEVRWQVEIDPWCQRVLAKHWPKVPRYDDIKAIDWTEVEPVDLICGGFPCQPVSLAGKRLAQADERWLWPEFERCLRVLRPRWALMENVPGLLSAAMGDVLGDLAALGYDAEWDCIPAAAVGAPHLRYRVLIVAHTTGRRTMRLPVRPWKPCTAAPDAVGGGQDVADVQRPNGRHMDSGVAEIFRQEPTPDASHGQWAVEPDVGRVANGVPHRVDRLRGLGNAVVPQVAEWIGRQIMAVAP
jgi:DNA (cytosine-5)-methyltransferase 1